MLNFLETVRVLDSGYRWDVDVFVTGRAAVLTALKPTALPWKLACFEAAKGQWTGDFLAEPCTLDLTFTLDPVNYKRTALFNLLKSTVDGVARALFAPARVGAGEWDCADWWIDYLVARKVIGQDVGTRIRVGRGVVPTEPVSELILHVQVPGSPPPWPGDAAGQARVLAWKETLKTIAGHQPIAPCEVAAGFNFNVEAERFRRSDLDNFCVPAGQAICEVLFGGVGQQSRLVEIRSSKGLASGAPFTHVSAWRAEL